MAFIPEALIFDVDGTLAETEELHRHAFNEAFVAGDEVAAQKPAPDVYQLTLQRLRVGAQHAVAIEDSLNGLEAAQAAGLACVVAPGRYTAYQDLGAADLLLDELAGMRLADLAKGCAA